MACERTLNALIEHAAGAAASADLLQHLESCADCADELAACRKAIEISERTLRDVVAAEPSPALLESARRLVLTPPARTVRMRRWAGWMAGATGLAVAALAIVVLTLRPPGVEEPELAAVARLPVPVPESSEPRPEGRVRAIPVAEPVPAPTAAPEDSDSGDARTGAGRRASAPPPASTVASPPAPPAEPEPPRREGEPGPLLAPEADWRVAALPPLPAPEEIALDPPAVARVAVPAIELAPLAVEPIAEPAPIEVDA